MKKLIIAALLFACTGGLYAQVWEVREDIGKPDNGWTRSASMRFETSNKGKTLEGAFGADFFWAWVDDSLRPYSESFYSGSKAVVILKNSSGRTLAVKTEADLDISFRVPCKPQVVIPGLAAHMARSLGVDKYGYFEDLVEFLIPPGAVEMAVTDGEKSYTFTINTAGFAEAFAKL